MLTQKLTKISTLYVFSGWEMGVGEGEVDMECIFEIWLLFFRKFMMCFFNLEFVRHGLMWPLASSSVTT